MRFKHKLHQVSLAMLCISGCSIGQPRHARPHQAGEMISQFAAEPLPAAARTIEFAKHTAPDQVNHNAGKISLDTVTQAASASEFQLISHRVQPESQVNVQTSPTPVVQLANDLQTTLSVNPSSETKSQFGSPLDDPLSHNPHASNSTVFAVDLPMALAQVGGQHPVVGLARWRVQEAYAQMHQAQVLWLPSIQSGFSFHNHDGNYQASNGDIVDINRNSFQYGLGMGATGAGTTPQPGVVAQFNLADAYFQPEIAKRNAWALSHAADGVLNQQLLDVAVAYLDLLDANQAIQIAEEIKQRTAEVTRFTIDSAEAGEGLQADAERMRTELNLLETRIVSARERSEVAAARLAQVLSFDGSQPIVPLDTSVVAIEMTEPTLDTAALIATGLGNRPELKESRALVSAACEQYKRQQYAPFIPSVLLGFSTGGFGGGTGGNLSNIANRYDFDALASWQIRNLGWGERHARQRTSAQVQQAKFEQLRMMDQIAYDISEAHTQIRHRRDRIALAEKAIQSALTSYQQNLSRIRDGHGLPLEVLQSLRALEEARNVYLTAVSDFNRAQFRLQWALGWPIAPPPAINP